MRNCDDEVRGDRGRDSLESLAQRHLAGDRDASQDLFCRLQAVASRAVRRVLGASRQADWDDACQTALIRLFDKLHTWEGRCPLEPFAYVVFVRAALGFVRGRQPPLALGQPLAPVANPESPPDPAVRECLQFRLAKFKPNWRKALELRLAGHSDAQIAEYFGRKTRVINLWFQAMYEQLAECLRP